MLFRLISKSVLQVWPWIFFSPHILCIDQSMCLISKFFIGNCTPYKISILLRMFLFYLCFSLNFFIFCFMTQFDSHRGFPSLFLNSLPSPMISPLVFQWVFVGSFHQSIILPLRYLPTIRHGQCQSPTSNCQDMFSHFSGIPSLYCMHRYILLSVSFYEQGSFKYTSGMYPINYRTSALSPQRGEKVNFHPQKVNM